MSDPLSALASYDDSSDSGEDGEDESDSDEEEKGSAKAAAPKKTAPSISALDLLDSKATPSFVLSGGFKADKTKIEVETGLEILFPPPFPTENDMHPIV
jgi:hypothetical protein